MNDPIQKAIDSQLKNIQKRTGKNLEELFAIVTASGLEKHGQIRTMLIENLGMGYGDANTLAGIYLKQKEEPLSVKTEPEQDVVDAFYTGSKSTLIPIHNAVMNEINQFGDFDLVPKKTYVSLRRKRQFAMLGPGTKGRVELGLNMKGLQASDRLIAQPEGSMCQYKVYLTNLQDVDNELISWIKIAYESAG